MAKIEFNDFYNDGFGWICKHCERELNEAETESPETHQQARIMREGEAESKQPRFSNPALAKWFDQVQTTLICPRCGITERVD